MFNKCIYVIALVGMTFVGITKEQNFFFSDPIGLPLAGWNKVLCMKNGNTVLFHLEPKKNIEVFVFDTSHKLISESKEATRYLDMFMIEGAVFNGLLEVNGEAVLFFDMERFAKHTLIRLRYNGITGKLIEEDIVGESPGSKKRTDFWVMKNNEEAGYAILFSTDIPQFKECRVFVNYYNYKHEVVTSVNLNMERKKYDYLFVLGAEMRNEGTLITLGLDKEVEFGKETKPGREILGGSKFNHFVSNYFIPRNEKIPRANLLDLKTDFCPFYSFFGYNEYANNINSFIFSYKTVDNRFGAYNTMLNISDYGDEYYYNSPNGIDNNIMKVNDNGFFVTNPEDMKVSFKLVENKIAGSFFDKYTDSSRFYNNIPVKMFTNSNGLTTLFYQGMRHGTTVETRARSVYQNFYGDISVTQLNDTGAEIWGTVLPLSQYHKSFLHFNNINDMAKHQQKQAIFRDAPPQIYDMQFASINCYCYRNNFYIIFNDYNKNLNNNLENEGDTVIEFENTNTFVYKINNRNQVSKSYLYEKPIKDEYKCSFIEGADFDEKRGIYTTLVQYKHDGRKVICVAWKKLE